MRDDFGWWNVNVFDPVSGVHLHHFLMRGTSAHVRQSAADMLGYPEGRFIPRPYAVQISEQRAFRIHPWSWIQNFVR